MQEKKQERGIRVYYTNSRSIRNKIDLLRSKASVEKLHIIAITESWINTTDRHFLPELEIEDYSLFHRDRAGRKGGGVALIVRDGVKCIINNSIKVENDTESLWVEAVGKKGKLIIGDYTGRQTSARKTVSPSCRRLGQRQGLVMCVSWEILISGI